MELVGIASATLASGAIVPQIYKSWKSGSSGDISTYTICVTYMAMILGIIYGSLIKHMAIYLGNSVTLVLYMTLHGVKIRNERKKDLLLDQNSQSTETFH